MNQERPIFHAARAALSIPTRRQVVVGGALVAAVAAGYAFQPTKVERLLGNAKLNDLVPKNFAGWKYQAASGLVLPPQDQLRDKIYSQLLTRVYSRDDGASIMLLIAYSGTQDGTIQVHRPETCYPASGFHLSTIAQHLVPVAAGVTIPSRYIVADADLRHEQLVYWTRLGGHFPTQWSEQKTAVIAENFAGIIPDGVLVRVSSVVSGDATAMFDGFVRDLYGAVGTRMKQVLVGTALSGGGGTAR